MSVIEQTNAGLMYMGNFIDNVKNIVGFTTSKSLIDVASVTRVEPLTILDNDCLNYEHTNDIMGSLLGIFAGYYIQAVAITGNRIDGVSVGAKLAPLNPHRSMFDMQSHVLSSEAYKYKLPTIQKNEISLENKGLEKDIDLLNEQPALSFGRMYNIKLKPESGNNEITVPVNIRLKVTSVPSNTLVDVLANRQGDEHLLVERYHMFRSGAINFFKDFVLCNDLIDKHRRNLIKDKNGVYNTINHNDINNKLAGLINITKSPSLANASNIVIISTDTATALETTTNRKLKKSGDRAHIFEASNIMILCVVDKAWEQITYYYRGIDEESQISVKALKKSKDNTDIMSVLSTFIKGSAPTL